MIKITPQAVLERWRLFAIVGVCLILGAAKAWNLTHNRGYQPDQPIAYSHALHAGVGEGQLGIQCLYCHSNAEKSKHATVPPMDTCMGCHSVVRVDRPEIQKLTEYWKAGKPVEWVRIHSMPDHVYFNHSAHVAAGVACQTCHGPVQEMEKVYQWVDMSMGWCMTCHRSDEYLKTPERQTVVGSADASKADKLTVAMVEKGSAEYASIVERTGGIWDANDLSRALEGKTPQEMHEVIVKSIGYDSLARQKGTRRAMQDVVAQFQNAPLNCNTCHQ